MASFLAAMLFSCTSPRGLSLAPRHWMLWHSFRRNLRRKGLSYVLFILVVIVILVEVEA